MISSALPVEIIKEMIPKYRRRAVAGHLVPVLYLICTGTSDCMNMLDILQSLWYDKQNEDFV